ncbi:MAG: hypothetical protein ACTSUE_21430 [Promethearchaeota archaeon]
MNGEEVNGWIKDGIVSMSLSVYPFLVNTCKTHTSSPYASSFPFTDPV